MLFRSLNIKDINSGKIKFTQKKSTEESSTANTVDNETEKYISGGEK